MILLKKTSYEPVLFQLSAIAMTTDKEAKHVVGSYSITVFIHQKTASEQDRRWRIVLLPVFVSTKKNKIEFVKNNLYFI